MLGIEYVVSVLNKYFAPVFTNEKNVDDREISGGGGIVTCKGSLRSQKKVVLGLLKTIMVDKFTRASLNVSQVTKRQNRLQGS